MADRLGSRSLFRVELIQTIYVLAEDDIEAERDAPGYARDDVGGPTAIANRITKHSGRLLADDMDSLPHWNAEGDPPTVGEALEIIKARTVKP